MGPAHDGYTVSSFGGGGGGERRGKALNCFILKTINYANDIANVRCESSIFVATLKKMKTI